MVNRICIKTLRKGKTLFLAVVFWTIVVTLNNYLLKPVRLVEETGQMTVSTRQVAPEMDPLSGFRYHDDHAVGTLLADLQRNNRSLLVQFSSWDFNEEKTHIHKTIMQLWRAWYPVIQNILFTNDDVLKQQALEMNWMTGTTRYSVEECYGPPILKYLYLDSFKMKDSIFYGYVNSDIAFGNGLLDTLLFIATQERWTSKPLIIVGRRSNIPFNISQSLSTPEQVQDLLKNGSLVIRSSDYFFTNKAFPWDKMGNFSVGRPLIVRAVLGFSALHNIDVIDTTLTVANLHLTTEDGIKSSFDSPGMECNEEPLLNEFKDIPLDMGHCECATLETYYMDGKIQIRYRESNWTICDRTRVPFANFPTCLLKCPQRGFIPVRKNQPKIFNRHPAKIEGKAWIDMDKSQKNKGPQLNPDKKGQPKRQDLHNSGARMQAAAIGLHTGNRETHKHGGDNAVRGHSDSDASHDNAKSAKKGSRVSFKKPSATLAESSLKQKGPNKERTAVTEHSGANVESGHGVPLRKHVGSERNAKL